MVTTREKVMRGGKENPPETKNPKLRAGSGTPGGFGCHLGYCWRCPRNGEEFFCVSRYDWVKCFCPAQLFKRNSDGREKAGPM